MESVKTDAPRERLGRKQRQLLVLILLLAFCGRVALRMALIQGQDHWRSGYSFYYRMAQQLLTNGVLTFGGDESGQGGYRCFRAPAYPVLVAAICWITNDSAIVLITLQAALSTVTVFIVFFIARFVAGVRPGLWAAAICAATPYSFYHDTQLQENVLYHVFSTAAFAASLGVFGSSCNSMGWLAGTLNGIAVLTRFTHLPIFGAMCAVVLWDRRLDTKQRLPRAASGLLAGMLVMTPWVVRNWAISGRVALSSSGFGIGPAHNRNTFDYYPYRGSIDQSWRAYHLALTPAQRAELDRLKGNEFAISDWHCRQALQYVQTHPLETLRRGAIKVAVNFLGVLSPLQDRFKNWVYFVSAWTLTLLALPGLWQMRRSQYMRLLWGVVAAHCVVSFVFWAHTSHRSFLDPLVAVAAGVGCQAMFERWRAAVRGSFGGSSVITH
jgi:4-amino-4-deoxy-L-arabinose transferase-like glycosyltransferase